MRSFILLFLLLLSSLVSLDAQTTYSIQPINLAVMLLDDSDLDKMVETCEYYNLSKEEGKGDYTTYKHPDGAVIRFKIQENDNERKPVIEVMTKEKPKKIKKALAELNFHKRRDEYIRGSLFTIKYSSCIIHQGNPTLLIFTKNNVALPE